MNPTFTSIGISRLRMLNDGEGVTTLVAGSGCPLRCKYCLNPQCFEANPANRTWTVASLIDEVKVDDLYFQATGGGVTFGGGEPLLYSDFIHEFRKACPSTWRINLESALNVPCENLLTIIEDIDFYLIDIKDMNPSIYQNYTGITNDRTIENLKLLIQHVNPKKVQIRLPQIPSYNTDSDRDASEAALRAMGYTRFERFDYDTDAGAKKTKAIRPW